MANPIRQSAAAAAVLTALLFFTVPGAVEPLPAKLHTRPEQGDAEEMPAAAAAEQDAGITLRVLKDGQVEEMDLAAYLRGVVSAEMPASFEPEALKAQAVAARTYTLYHLAGGSAHGAVADICTDPACCQAYAEDPAAGWGAEAERYGEKIRRAVEETDGQVLLYENEPILAVFHAASAGLTRPAGEVWSSDVPYLQPVPSPEDPAAPDYYSQAVFSGETFRSRITAAHPEAVFPEDPALWLQNAVTDEAGSVIRVEVGGVSLRGSEVRSLLGLRSACFTWEARDGGLVFSVTGYGHGVGLSQRGANKMAEEGADWREILAHYYTGVDIGGCCFTNGPES